MTQPAYGRFDGFQDGSLAEAEKVRELIERLERRGRSPDEAATRTQYLDLLNLKPGDHVLDAGCGSGVVTRDVARRLGPQGRVTGLDPGPGFLAAARELARQAGLAERIELREGDVRALPFPDAAFDVALAVTVLSHVPGGEKAIPELARVVRPGGRVAIFDLDTDSLIIAHPDRVLTRRVVSSHSDHAVIDGWLGRRLPGLLTQAGLVDVKVRAFTPMEREPDGFYGGVADRAAEIAVQVGALTEAERAAWMGTLNREREAGRFLAGRTHLFAWGVKPRGSTGTGG
jgi:SAM-dependent methyltransferase